MARDLREGIIATAQALGMNPVDLATIISYETGGTFDPMQPGPTTKWGKHRGLIQFGEPQARQYGVDFSSPEDAMRSQLGPDGAIVKYYQSSGWKPGMGMLDAYSIVNAGGPGRYNASDTAAGGAPGTVRDKVEKQMADHRQKAMGLIGGQAAPPLPPPREIASHPVAPVQSSEQAPKGLLALLGGGEEQGESQMNPLLSMLSQQQETPQPQMLQPPAPMQGAGQMPQLASYLQEFLKSRMV